MLDPKCSGTRRGGDGHNQTAREDHHTAEYFRRDLDPFGHTWGVQYVTTINPTEHLVDNTALYGTPDGYSRIVEFYDRTMDQIGLSYEDRFVRTGSGLTHVISCGNPAGRPVVLWHGQNANASTWARWIPSLAPEYSIYAVDTVGGLEKSAPERLDRKSLAYGEWAAGVLEGLELSRASMIGVTNGGWIIIKLGVVAQDLVEKAILLSTAGLASLSFRLVLQIVVRSLGRDPKLIADKLVELISPPDQPADQFYVEFFELILSSKFRAEQIAPRISNQELVSFTPPAYLLMGQYENCLLYTSPSPRDRQKSRMPSSA
jgi:pimeloyl-ACP methyl ester carboxylesterase